MSRLPFAANGLHARLRDAAGADWARFVGHRFVQQVAAGTLDRAEFLAWMVQDYLYLVQYARAWALLAYKSDTVAGMGAASRILAGLLEQEMTLHRDQLGQDGISAAALEAAEPTIETLAYGGTMLDRAQTGDVLDLMVVLAPCLVGYAEIGVRLLATAVADNPYRSWIETYGGAAYVDLAQEGAAQLDQLAARHGGTARFDPLLRQFRQVVRLETAFWDAGRTALARAGR